MPQNSTRSPRILLLLAYLYVGLGVFIVGICLLPVQHQGMVNPSADLDTSNISDLRTQYGQVGLAAGADFWEYPGTGDLPSPPADADVDGRVFVPQDLDGDGDIEGDLELGA